ncbi:hypothetical protein GE21DRAFT_1280605 [Neurospora crassa]|nr:hypothetical protein GE21DRAFT_1280605 [Neurospora crassa]
MALLLVPSYSRSHRRCLSEGTTLLTVSLPGGPAIVPAYLIFVAALSYWIVSMQELRKSLAALFLADDIG